MSKPESLTPSMFNQMLAQLGQSGFLDQGFINTMRFSELNGDEEYDNTFLYAIWHGFLETGLQQTKEYREWIVQQKASKTWDEVPRDQKERIDRLLVALGQYQFDKPVDDKENIRIIRNYLQDYNENFMDGIMFYDCHTAILNGRMARARGHKKELLELSSNVLQRDQQEEAENKRSLVDKLLGRE